MLELLSDPAVWAAFLTLTVMEIVLGIDNIVFISVLVSKLPKEQANRARQWGIGLALVFRILLLLVISWIIALEDPIALFTELGNLVGLSLHISWKDVILIAGGGFLIYKATHEMHAEIEEPHTEDLNNKAGMAFASIITQIILIDMVFSIDSIITAVGMADHVEVMIAAVIVAVGIMFLASGPIAKFVADHPTTKMLALAFLLLIGTSLVIDGFHESFGFEIPKGYIYAAMAFSVLVEAINIIAKQRKAARKAAGAARHAAAATVPDSAAVAAVAGAQAPKGRSRSTSSSRAKARPKSAPRKK
jgi:predicted tellurium resistance membrane protein TerC